MHIDPRLNEIDDCLYRVANKAFIVKQDKVLLVKEVPEMWWAFPGGGVDHGETIESSLYREIEEELGVAAKNINTNLQIAHYTIGAVVNNVPRMNLYFHVSFPVELLKTTNQVAKWAWFTKQEFMNIHMGPSYDDRAGLARAIFGIVKV